MALALRLLPLLLWKANGDPLGPLQGHPGDRVNLSCMGVSHPTRWAWAPSFPACTGLSKGRRPILWNSSSGTPTVPTLQHFAGRLRPLGPSIQRLELLLSAGDSGTFYCKGRQENESRTVLHVLGDRAYCKALGPTHGSDVAAGRRAGIGTGSAGRGLVAAQSLQVAELSLAPPAAKENPRNRTGDSQRLILPYRRGPRHPLGPLSTSALYVNVEPQRSIQEDAPKIPGNPEQEPSLHYANLDQMALRRPRRLSEVVSADAPTVYAVVV
ncbi:megakaryocyte and platelet inhibitory receptor G6b isoform X2 [Perognathus longimembris pacificus]|uniref:megakaryocyte and platelet inhibitory receptor G6b isoform X2 n=1 Tax=Perognathus longimembris pacificus TaxID=214514 RepID=UPI002018D373|nr:megakaryocyte and platelet inhibitory receptor G6b isoform X2 [Perognathus longimembris pacificus]